MSNFDQKTVSVVNQNFEHPESITDVPFYKQWATVLLFMYMSILPLLTARCAVSPGGECGATSAL
jgi:hypothetical protein